ncbi:MAG: hypothetical protein WAO96_01010 [Limnochordia bacterium]
MRLALKMCVLTLLMSLMVGAAASGAEPTRRWTVIAPQELPLCSSSFLHDLAEELGIEAEELMDALKNAAAKRIEQLKEGLRERLKGGRQEEREEMPDQTPERRPDRQTIIIQPPVVNRRPFYFPPGSVQRPRTGIGTLWRFYPGYGMNPYMNFRVWPGAGRR